jgi:hypothetical protein
VLAEVVDLDAALDQWFLHDKFLGSELQLLPGARHDLQVEAPERVAKVLFG